MTLLYTGANGVGTILGYFTARGLDLDALRGGTATARVLGGASWDTFQQNVVSAYATSPRKDGELETFVAENTAFQAELGRRMKALAKQAERFLVKAVRDDNGQPDLTLTRALLELERQMRADSQSFQAAAPSIGAQTNTGSPTGTSIVVLSGKDGKGRTLENLYPEKVFIRVIGDAQESNAYTSGQELYEIAGRYALDPGDKNWPGGSGARITLRGVDSTLSYSGAEPNVLYNSDYETTTNGNGNFDNWINSVGSAGTTIVTASSANSYRGSKGIEFVGNGVLAHQVYQPFMTEPSTSLASGGTPYVPKAHTPYNVNYWVKVSSTPGAGTLALELVNDSGTIINDDQGTANRVSKDLTGVSTSWVNVNGTFRLPATVPSAVRIQWRFTTVLSNTISAYVDSLAMHPARQLYPGGPYVSVFTGATKPVVGDQWSATIAAGTVSYLQRGLWRMFGHPALHGVHWPTSSGAPTMADILVI